MSALSLVPGINESYQMGLFQILAAILHLGNVEVKDRDADSSIIPVSVCDVPIRGVLQSQS